MIKPVACRSGATGKYQVTEEEYIDDTLFSSLTWFDHWLSAFGEADSGYWSPPGKERTLRIPYLIQDRKIGIFQLRVAAGAANSHTPRFDACGRGLPTPGDLLDMIASLKVSGLVFPYITDDSKIGLLAQGHGGGWTFLDDCEIAPYIDCTGSWEAYLESRGKSRRTSWLYYERRALKSGSCFENLDRWEDIAANLDEVLEVEASGWKGKEGTAIRQSVPVLNFYRNFAEDFARQGKLRLFLHRRDGTIIAFQLCTLHAGVLSCLKIGYREELAKESPGQVLQLWIVKWAFEQEQVRIFDMLGPASETKMRWATGQQSLKTLYVFRRSPGGAILWLRYSLLPRLKQKFRKFVGEQPGLEEREPAVTA